MVSVYAEKTTLMDEDAYAFTITGSYASSVYLYSAFHDCHFAAIWETPLMSGISISDYADVRVLQNKKEGKDKSDEKDDETKKQEENKKGPKIYTCTVTILNELIYFELLASCFQQANMPRFTSSYLLSIAQEAEEIRVEKEMKEQSEKTKEKENGNFVIQRKEKDLIHVVEIIDPQTEYKTEKNKKSAGFFAFLKKS